MDNQKILEGFHNGIDVLHGLIETQGLILTYVLYIFILTAIFKIFANLKNHKHILSYLIDILNYIFALLIVYNPHILSFPATNISVGFSIIFIYLLSNIGLITIYLLLVKNVNKKVQNKPNEDESKNSSEEIIKNDNI